MESKYLEKFSKLKPEQLPIRSDRILIEVMPKLEIKSAGGLILSAPTDHKLSTELKRGVLGVVLATGPGYYDEDGNLVEMSVKPGAVVTCANNNLDFYSEFPGLSEYTSEKLAILRDRHIMAEWPSINAFLEYKKTLNNT